MRLKGGSIEQKIVLLNDEDFEEETIKEENETNPKALPAIPSVGPKIIRVKKKEGLDLLFKNKDPNTKEGYHDWIDYGSATMGVYDANGNLTRPFDFMVEAKRLGLSYETFLISMRDVLIGSAQKEVEQLIEEQNKNYYGY